MSDSDSTWFDMGYGYSLWSSTPYWDACHVNAGYDERPHYRLRSFFTKDNGKSYWGFRDYNGQEHFG